MIFIKVACGNNEYNKLRCCDKGTPVNIIHVAMIEDEDTYASFEVRSRLLRGVPKNKHVTSRYYHLFVGQYRFILKVTGRCSKGS